MAKASLLVPVPYFVLKTPSCNCTFHFQSPTDFLTSIQSCTLHSVLKSLVCQSPHIYACWSSDLHCLSTFQPDFRSQHQGCCPQSLFCGFIPLSWDQGGEQLFTQLAHPWPGLRSPSFISLTMFLPHHIHTLPPASLCPLVRHRRGSSIRQVPQHSLHGTMS